MERIKIAVIGKSAAGKSAFIKSFSSTPDCINSVGKGQTTRSYAEYLFVCDDKGGSPQVEAEVIAQSSFCENRVSQVLDKIRDLKADKDSTNIDWVKIQFAHRVYRKRLKEILLNATDFFDIREFEFLDKDIVEWADKHFDNLERVILSELVKENNKEGEYSDEKDKREVGLEEVLNRFFKDVYERIIAALKKEYEYSSIFNIENGIWNFKFHIDSDEAKSIFTMLLKVDDVTHKSLTGIISKVRITSGLNKKYAEKLKYFNINCVSLIDTYGLDHSENIGREILTERYHRIFNNDYPEISVAFFVEALHAGASNEFKDAITILYEVKPEIMTYVIGTYIDENESELAGKEEWLFSKDKKAYDAPCLNGKVQQIMNNDTALLATLLEQGISESMAEKRCEVMQKRFAPFCGKLEASTGRIDYKKVNIVSIEALFSSIANKEHLGDGYIPIDTILKGISQVEILVAFSKQFIINIQNRFKQIYEISASRTRGKIRVNLENYILGFDGSTLDATWKRVFKDAFNMTFAKEIEINGKMQMLSDVLKIEGNSKIAFDEIIVTIAPYLFRRECKKEEYLNTGVYEIDCSRCAEKQIKVNKCIWNTFMIAASFAAFRERDKYTKVIEWLNALHKFDDMDGLAVEVTKQLQWGVNENFIPLCRQHNLRLASKSIRNSTEPYIVRKEEVFSNYKEKFDINIDKKEFDEIVNQFLSNEIG